MTNFDFLKADPQFSAFSDVAISAEKILNIDAAASVLNCRRAMEFAVKWMYSVDKDLEMPYDTNLITLMSSEDFRDVVGNDIYRRMDFIRKVGNIAAHGGKKISMEQAKLYADILEKQCGRRPVVFLTNGFETRIDDGQYPERKIATIYSKRDFEKMFNLRRMRTSLKNVMVDKNIAGRYYQESA